MSAPTPGHLHVDLGAFGPLEWALVAGAALATVWSIWRAVRLTLDPGEEDPAHLKRLVFREPGALAPRGLEVEVRWPAAPSGAAPTGPAPGPAGGPDR